MDGCGPELCPFKAFVVVVEFIVAVLFGTVLSEMSFRGTGLLSPSFQRVTAEQENMFGAPASLEAHFGFATCIIDIVEQDEEVDGTLSARLKTNTRPV